MSLFTWMKDNIKSFLMLISLFIVNISTKIFSLEFNLNNLSKPPFIMRIYKFKNKKRLIEIVNFFFQKKYFSCLSCSILVKKIYFNDSEVRLCIGTNKTKNEFNSHAWVEYKGKNIFGEIKGIKKYTKIYTG